MPSTEEQIRASMKGIKAPDLMHAFRSAMAPQLISDINRRICLCNDCGLCSRTKTIAWGNPNASVMVISDYANADLHKACAPFEGSPEAGILSDTFGKLNINPGELLWMNAVNCYMSGKTPNLTQVDKCSAFVKYVVDVVHPALIILMGNVALNCFVNSTIAEMHGKWVYAYTIPAMPAYSPTQLYDMHGKIDEIRWQKMMSDFQADIGNAFKWLQTAFPDSNVFL